MSDRDGIFAGDDPFDIARRWLGEAEGTEPNDPNAIALATVDGEGRPNVRMVLLKDIEDDAFIFYTNYDSAKGTELGGQPVASFVMHWKSLRRQVRVRAQHPHGRARAVPDGQPPATDPNGRAIGVAIADNLIVGMGGISAMRLKVGKRRFQILGKDDVLPFGGIVRFAVRIDAEKLPEFRAHPFGIRVFKIPVPDPVQ